MFNPYVDEPFKLVVFDPRAGGPAAGVVGKPTTHVFLTGAPKTVLAQCRRISSADPALRRAGKTAEKETGPDGLPKSIFRAEAVPGDAPLAAGGLESEAEAFPAEYMPDSDMFADFDRPGEIVIKDTMENITVDRKEIVTNTARREPGVVFHGMDVFPDDNVKELRSKIFVATGVEPYRQHLFTIKYDGTEKNFYEIFFNNTPLPVSIRGETGAAFETDQTIDKNRDMIRIEPREEFATLGNEGVKIMYMVDLLEIFPPARYAAELANNPYLLDQIYYGVVLKYWPQTPRELFKLAMMQPGKAYEIFPALAPDVDNARETVEVVNKLSMYVYKHAKPIKAGYSITRATVVVPPRVFTKVDIRNTFDWVKSTCDYPIMALNFRPSAVKTRDQVTVIKQNVTICSVNAREILKRVPKEFSVTFMLPKTVARRAPEADPSARGKASGQPADPSRILKPPWIKHNLGNYTALSVSQSGKYVIRSNWDRDMSFEGVNRELTEFAKLTIPEINRMGTAALIAGEALKVPAGKPSPIIRDMIPEAYYGSLDLYVIWKKAVTTRGFNMIRNELVKYERYGLIDIKTAETAQNTIGFYFRKGDVYQMTCLDRILALYSSSTGVVNLYDHMSDPAAMNRWSAVFRGRMVTLTHRTTDIRVDYSCVTYGELTHIHAYVVSLLAEVSAREEFEVETSDVRNRLRGLQEADPELFDLRRHDPESKLYSVLCQSDRQPITTSDRGKAARMKRAVEFWNFTENKPQWYSCPARDYPFLTFRVGEHPLGYCLPCCKKDAPAENTRGAFIQNKCLARHAWNEENEDELKEGLGGAYSQQTRHILGYGKPVVPGRISAIPQVLEQGLFYGDIDSDYKFRLVGVEQSLPAIPDAGFVFAAAKGLDMSLEELITEFAATIKEMGALYTSVGFGSGRSFATNEALVGALMTGFVERSPGFSPFGPGGKSVDDWREMFESLIYFSKRVVVMTVEDETGNETLTLRVHPARFASLTQSAAGEKMRLMILVKHPNGIYPMALINQNSYVRVAKASSFVFDPSDEFVKIIIDMVGKLVETRRDKPVDYALIKEFCAKDATYAMSKKYVNNRNICYALSLSAKRAESAKIPPPGIYIPIQYEIVRIDGVPIEYGFPDRDDLPEKKDALKLVKGLAAFADGRRKYIPITVGEQLVAGDRAIGFRIQGLNMYHAPVAASGLANSIAVNFDVFDVNSKLYLVNTESELPERKNALADKASYINNLYEFLVGEFVARLRQDKNEAARAKIMAALRKAAASTRGLIAFKTAVLAAASPDGAGAAPNIAADLPMLWTILDESYSLGDKSWKATFADKFRNTSFGFDMITLEQMRGETVPQLKNHLAEYLKPVVQVKKMRQTDDYPAVGNILTQCSNSDIGQGQCKEGKLIVSEDLYADFLDILASDIRNPYADILRQEGQNVDEMAFIERPEEQLVYS